MNQVLRTLLRRQRFFSVLSLICLYLVTMLIRTSAIPTAHAATLRSDPLVVVAIDTTPSTCVITHTVKNHLGSLVTHIHCPAGTAISPSKIPLSQAKIHHESYVTYPASPQQIRGLTQAKRAVLQSTQNKIVHPATCDGGGYEGYSISATYYQPGTHTNGTLIYMSVYFDGASNCSNLFLDQEEVTGSDPVRTAAYWTSVNYSYYNGFCALRGNNYIGDGDLNVYPDVTEKSGLYNVWWIGDSGACLSSQATSYQVQLNV